MPFTADLNPKNNKSMDLTDLAKLDDYMNRYKGTAKAEPKKAAPTPAPVYDKSTPWENTDLNTGKGDSVIPFKFGAGNSQD